MSLGVICRKLANVGEQITTIIRGSFDYAVLSIYLVSQILADFRSHFIISLCRNLNVYLRDSRQSSISASY